VGHDTFIGMETLIFNAKIGSNVAIGVGSTITGGVEIPDGKYVPPGSVIDTQEEADSLGPRIGSPYEGTNAAVVHVNENLAIGYEKKFGEGQLANNFERITEIETGLGVAEDDLSEIEDDLKDEVKDVREDLDGGVASLTKDINNKGKLIWIAAGIVLIICIILFLTAISKISNKNEIIEKLNLDVQKLKEKIENN